MCDRPCQAFLSVIPVFATRGLSLAGAKYRFLSRTSWPTRRGRNSKNSKHHGEVHDVPWLMRTDILLSKFMTQVKNYTLPKSYQQGPGMRAHAKRYLKFRIALFSKQYALHHPPTFPIIKAWITEFQPLRKLCIRRRPPNKPSKLPFFYNHQPYSNLHQSNDVGNMKVVCACFDNTDRIIDKSLLFPFPHYPCLCGSC